MGVNTENSRKRKQSLPINLPSPEYKEKEINSNKSICGTLPPPHNPRNPYDPVRRNSLLNINRSQLNKYLAVNNQKNDIDDDAVSVVSDLSILSDHEQI